MGNQNNTMAGIISPSTTNTIRKGVTTSTLPPMPGSGTEITTAEYQAVVTSDDGSYVTHSTTLAGNRPYFIASFRLFDWMGDGSLAINGGLSAYGRSGNGMVGWTYMTRFYIWNPGAVLWEFVGEHANQSFGTIFAWYLWNVAPQFVDTGRRIYLAVINPNPVPGGEQVAFLYLDWAVCTMAWPEAMLIDQEVLMITDQQMSALQLIKQKMGAVQGAMDQMYLLIRDVETVGQNPRWQATPDQITAAIGEYNNLRLALIAAANALPIPNSA